VTHFQSNYFRNVQKNHHLLSRRRCVTGRSAFRRAWFRRLALIEWNELMQRVARKFASRRDSTPRDSGPVYECGGVAAVRAGLAGGDAGSQISCDGLAGLRLRA
jgi:hypothetical protein